MDHEAAVTDAVTQGLSEEDAERYRALFAKDRDDLADEERQFLGKKENKALERGLAGSLLRRGEPLGCTCNAGMSVHRQDCPLYGQSSGASQFMDLLRGRRW